MPEVDITDHGQAEVSGQVYVSIRTSHGDKATGEVPESCWGDASLWSVFDEVCYWALEGGEETLRTAPLGRTASAACENTTHRGLTKKSFL